MAFKDNLLKKIKIDQLAAKVVNSLGAPADSSRRVDRETMQTLLSMGPFRHQRERDLDLYYLPGEQAPEQILVLDNEMKIYRTTAGDVALRKSPTIKEMVSIRNAIKILNDKDVVVCAKADSVRTIQEILVAGIDLSYTAADLEALVRDGCDALDNKYAPGVVETIDLFAELLGWQIPPRAFQAAHHHVRGALTPSAPGSAGFGPLVFYSMMQNRLGILKSRFDASTKLDLQRWQQVLKAEEPADAEGEQALELMKTEALKRKPLQS